MGEAVPNSERVDQFLLQHVDTVPHLEALLLLWNSRPRAWNVEDMAAALFLRSEATAEILARLVQLGLVVEAGNSPDFCYNPDSPERDLLMRDVELSYRRELVRISKMIHNKSSALNQFARAFDLRKPKS